MNEIMTLEQAATAMANAQLCLTAITVFVAKAGGQWLFSRHEVEILPDGRLFFDMDDDDVTFVFEPGRPTADVADRIVPVRERGQADHAAMVQVYLSIIALQAGGSFVLTPDDLASTPHVGALHFTVDQFGNHIVILTAGEPS